MASVSANPNAPGGILHVDESSMKTNRVDQTSSLLLSLMMLIGMAVIMLGVLFFLRSWTPSPPIFKLEPERIAGRGDHAEGFERDFDPPGAEEVEQLNEPAMEQTLQMVTETISTIAASLDSLESNSAANSNGSGKGDSRPPGPEGEGDDIVPRFDRWELKFTARDKRNYAIQLEAFKIDIGAIGGGIPTVDYVTNLASAPMKRSVTPKEEKARKRLSFMSVSENVLLQFERQILQSAGVPITGRQILKLVPKETEDALAQSEAAYFSDKRSKDIRIATIAKTVYECRPKSRGGGFEFVVIDQRYRAGPGPKK
jgi:hypothetical protein